jgi:hypothetical protein
LKRSVAVRRNFVNARRQPAKGPVAVVAETIAITETAVAVAQPDLINQRVTRAGARRVAQENSVLVPKENAAKTQVNLPHAGVANGRKKNAVRGRKPAPAPVPVAAEPVAIPQTVAEPDFDRQRVIRACRRVAQENAVLVPKENVAQVNVDVAIARKNNDRTNAVPVEPIALPKVAKPAPKPMKRKHQKQEYALANEDSLAKHQRNDVPAAQNAAPRTFPPRPKRLIRKIDPPPVPRTCLEHHNL